MLICSGMTSVETRLGYRLKRAQLAFRHRMEQQLRSLELSPAQYAALEALDETAAGASNAELARRCFVSPQAMHGVTRALEERGLIVRPADAETGRARSATPTPAGRRLLARARAEVAAVEEVAFGSLTPAQRRRLESTLDAIAAALEQA